MATNTRRCKRYPSVCMSMATSLCDMKEKGVMKEVPKLTMDSMTVMSSKQLVRFRVELQKSVSRVGSVSGVNAVLCVC